MANSTMKTWIISTATIGIWKTNRSATARCDGTVRSTIINFWKYLIWIMTISEIYSTITC